ncbi:MAG TPA: bifunctional adenosylcobinamide kinase/adenosylcobinamide-phosphate guanylyltransferase [Cyclobacteriaceae bacterium]
MLHLITGGTRSGKSRYGQEQAKRLDNYPTYIATARVWDADFKSRVKKHQLDRDDQWINLEIEKKISDINTESKAILIDCVTLWLTNYFVDLKQDEEKILAEMRKEIDHIVNKKSKNWIIITNEIGMGMHADTSTGRKFADLQGWINQYFAKKADKVTLMVSGLPLVVKDE